MAEPRLVADEMLGRLARYLRMLGADTIYARGWTDDEIVQRSAADGRTVLTRDRLLARRSAGALLLTSPRLDAQLRSVWQAFPALAHTPQFLRCTECNGELGPLAPGRAVTGAPGIPWDRITTGLVVMECRACGHLYWEGSHTRSVRDRLLEWEASGAP